MEKFEFKFMRVVVNDSFEIEAESRAEAFVRLVNRWQNGTLRPTGEYSVIREYVVCEEGFTRFAETLSEVDWEECELDMRDLEPMRVGGELVSKLGKYRGGSYTSSEIWRASRRFIEAEDLGGLDAEKAVARFVSYLTKED